MAETIRLVDYFYTEVPDKPGEAARILGQLRDAGVYLLVFSGFPKGRKAQPDFVAPDTAAFKAAAKKAKVKLVGPKKAFLIYGDDRVGIGAELLGLAGVIAEAEIIGIAAQGVMNQGVENWQLTIGHVGLMRLLLARFKLDPRTLRFLLSYLPALKDPALGKAYVVQQIDKLSLTREPDMVTVC